MNSDDIIRLYSETVGERSGYKLKFLHLFNLHAIIGACLKDQAIAIKGQKIDLRVHPFIIRESGSGKALSYNQAERLAEMVGLDWRTRTKITEAGLIGTIYRTKEGIETILGDAAEADIVGFTEANVLVKATHQSTTMMDVINQILDPKGEVFKRLAHGNISYTTRVTLVMSSYPSRLLYDQICGGFLQRCFLLYEYLPTDFFVKTSKWIVQNVGVDETETCEDALSKIANRLRKVKERNVHFRFEKGAHTVFNQIPTELEKLAKGYPFLPMLKTFITRYTNLSVKLACHHAALDLRNAVNKRDAEHARELCLLSFRGVCEFLSEYCEKDKKQQTLARVLFDRFRDKEKRKEVSLSELLRFANLKKERCLEMLQPYEYREQIRLERHGRGTWIVFLK